MALGAGFIWPLIWPLSGRSGLIWPKWLNFAPSNMTLKINHKE
jgi:hypothetical protein